MAAMDTVKEDLARILDMVETRAADGYGMLSFRAKAVGKTEDSLQLAVATGIISVPLTDITSIIPLRGKSDLEFQVDVRNGDRITYLREMPDRIFYSVNPGDPINPGDFPGFGPPTWPPRVPPRGDPGDPFGGIPHTPPGGYPIFGRDGGASTSTNDDGGMDTSTTSGMTGMPGMPGTMGSSADQTDDHRPFNRGDTD